MSPIRNLILVLGDQLSPAITSLAAGNPGRDLVLMAGLGTRRAPCAITRRRSPTCSRPCATSRRSCAGWAGRSSMWPWTRPAIAAPSPGSWARHRPERVIVTEAGEWRVRQMQASWSERFALPVDILPDERFLCSSADFARWAAGRKALRMEYFYREMRRRTGLLMDGDAPAGSRWNFDAENRKPAKADLFMPRPPSFAPDAVTQTVLALVEARFGDRTRSNQPHQPHAEERFAEARLEAWMRAPRLLPILRDAACGRSSSG